MSNPTVKCTVDECTHFMPGDRCMAAKISIYNDETGESKKAEQTQCKSFHSRKTVGDMIGAFHNANIGGTVTSFMDGTQITPELECFVNSCHFWENDNRCTASTIHVVGSNASHNQDTDCHTFSMKK